MAKMACRAVALGRAVAGRDMHARVRRGGIRWDLDLTEAIDLSIYLLGRFEARLALLLTRLAPPGGTVLDVGANIGSHTFPLARAVGESGRVLAYEPTSFGYGKLLANLALNPELAPRVVPVHAMLVGGAEDTPEAVAFASWPLTGGAGLHPQHLGRAMATDGARAVTLDDHLAEAGVTRVDLIKIDVDGAECAVLRGAAGTLALHRPVIVMEWAPYIHAELGHRLHECLSVVRGLGYTFEGVETRRRYPADFSDGSVRLPSGASINVVGRAEPAPAAPLPPVQPPARRGSGR
jgi:FkbM family methyltransferase